MIPVHMKVEIIFKALYAMENIYLLSPKSAPISKIHSQSEGTIRMVGFFIDKMAHFVIDRGRYKINKKSCIVQRII